MTQFSVKGIKSLDQKITLFFYKKTIDRKINTQNYNLKGIYGPNGSGKSAIIASVEILKNLLVNTNYLSNPIIHKYLGSLINRRTNELWFEIEYIVFDSKRPLHFRYEIQLKKSRNERYEINKESLFLLSSNSLKEIYSIENEEIKFLETENEEIKQFIQRKTQNLLRYSTFCSLFVESLLAEDLIQQSLRTSFVRPTVLLKCFAENMEVYLEQPDHHKLSPGFESFKDEYIFDVVKMDFDYFNRLSTNENFVLKSDIDDFRKEIDKLSRFLQIFKPDLKKIELDIKENREWYICDLIMVYEEYKIHSEYESTGIKKLIHLFHYIKKMANGKIVFIDELDANLHDVYLCALLEHLMEYGKGQLCFTTHNVGPMSLLKTRKKSIDFLSENHQIYPWVKNGNYSPSKLYRNGMIEGSLFNIDLTDFIGIFDSLGEFE